MPFIVPISTSPHLERFILQSCTHGQCVVKVTYRVSQGIAYVTFKNHGDIFTFGHLYGGQFVIDMMHNPTALNY